MTAAAFPPDVVEAVCRHMNDDHAADSVLICRTLGQVPDAVAARAVDVDGAGMRFEATVPDGARREIVIAFTDPVTERAQIRTAVVTLYERACAAAGLAPRGH